MRILFVISVLLLALMLWAVMSIVQHIRLALRRHQSVRTKQPALIDGALGLSQPVKSYVVLDPPANLLPSESAAAISSENRYLLPHQILGTAKVAQPMHFAEPVPALRHTSAANLVPVSNLAALVALLEAAISEASIPVAVEPITAAFQPQLITQSTALLPEAAIEPTTEPFFIAASAASGRSAALNLPAAPERRPPVRALPAQPATIIQPAAAASVEPDTDSRRPVRSAYPHPSNPLTVPSRRPDWAYFNKDMGDLSDPVPSRLRDRARSR